MNNLTSVQETSQVSPAEMKESKHKINTNIILSKCNKHLLDELSSMGKFMLEK